MYNVHTYANYWKVCPRVFDSFLSFCSQAFVQILCKNNIKTSCYLSRSLFLSIYISYLSICCLKAEAKIKKIVEHSHIHSLAGPQRFSPDLLVDADPRESVVNIIKSKLLDFIDGEVPFALQPRLEFWEVQRVS